MSSIPTRRQVSAGGVVYRVQGDKTEVALISVGEDKRWQLPKGMIGNDETPETAAQREVREEAGVDTELVAPIDTIEYWYYSTSRGRRIRLHKFVHFYLMRYLSGDVQDHDYEVNEARWVEINQAQAMLAFENEKKVLKLARKMIAKDQEG